MENMIETIEKELDSEQFNYVMKSAVDKFMKDLKLISLSILSVWVFSWLSP